MKAFLQITTLILVLCAAGFAQVQTPADLPTTGLVGHWKFDDANLDLATVGTDLAQEHVSGGTVDITAIDGPVTGNGAVTIGAGSFFRATHDIGANGGATDTLTNQYTIVMDARFAHLWSYRVFYNASADASDGGDIYSNTSGGIGGGSAIGGYSGYGVTDGGWFRVTFVADLGNSYKIYLDGQLINTASQGFEADARMSLDPAQFLIAHDDDGEDNAIDISEVAVYDHVLTEQEISDLGGYAHYAVATETVGLWEMNKADSLWFASMGADISVTGSQTAIQDTIRLGYTNLAAALESGASYTLDHGLSVVPVGFYGHGTKVNYYSMILDVRLPALGVSYELTPGLSVDADGKIGSSALGWSDFTFTAGEWYRIAIAVSLDNPSISDVAIWVDSAPVLAVDDLAVDGDMGLDVSGVQLFTDGNPIEVSNIKLYNVALPFSTVNAAGGYKHSIVATGGIEVTAQQDAYVRGGTNSDNNYNTYRLLTRGSSDPSYVRHTYLLFDLSSITEDVTSARIRLVTQFVGGVAQNGIAFYRSSDDSWLDSTITWNTAPEAGDLLFEDEVVPRVAQNKEPFNIHEYDVTAYVQDEINLGDYLVGFETMATNDDTDIRFFSLEGDDNYAELREWQKPTLVINGLTTTGIDSEFGSVPSEYQLSQNYPNPFNPSTTINFKLASDNTVSLVIYNVVGQEVHRLVNHELLNAGNHSVSWNTLDVPSGVYLYRLEGQHFSTTRKMILLK